MFPHLFSGVSKNPGVLLRYTIRRVLLTLPLLFGISILSFAILQLTPGSHVQAQGAMNPNMSPESIQKIRALYGLDDPAHIQYWNWLKRFARFDFGTSLSDHQAVTTKVLKALPATLLLNVTALMLILGLGVPLGIFSAARDGTRLEKSLTQFSFFAYSFPGFWLALLLQMGFAVKLGWVPVSGFRSLSFGDPGFWSLAGDILWHLLLPLAVTTFGAWAVISRYMRNSVLEVMAQDYIRTARAKGLSEQQIMIKHAAPNAMLPIITLLGLSVPGLISGSVIIETIFSWPGMGRLAWEAAVGYDFPVVMGVLMMGAILTVLGNLLADIGYAIMDPRVKY